MNRQRVAAAVRCWGETAFRWTIETIFPATCAGCGLSGTWMCSFCADELVRAEPAERVLPIPDPRADASTYDFRVRAAYRFGGPARKAIHLLKYRGQSARAEWCAEVIAGELQDALVSRDAVLVPVPLFHKRQQTRRFNQAEEIAKRLSDIWQCSYMDALVRERETRPQVELSGAERLENVRGAFGPQRSLAGKRVILVDDVTTTGATLRECAFVCLAAGATSVSGLVLAASDPSSGNSQRSRFQ